MSRTIKSALPLLLGNICLLFLLLAGGFFSFASASSLEVETALLLAGCAACSILFAVLWTVPYGGWGALALLGLDALAVWRGWERLEPAAAVLWEAASGGGEAFQNALRQLQYSGGTVMPALLLLLAALSFLLGWLAVRERCWHLPAVLVVTPLLSAMMAGTLPDLLPLLAETAGWGTLLLTSLYNRRDQASLGKGLWLSLGGMTAMLLLLLALMPQEGYERPEWATHARNQVVETVNRGFTAFWNGGDGGSIWNLDFGVSAPANGGSIDGQVDLTQAGPRRYSRQTVLQIIGGKQGRVYLRGGSSGVYTGTSWEPLHESEYGELPYAPETFPAQTAPDEALSETLTIKHVRGGGKNAYTPYRFLDFPDELARTVLDSGAQRRMDEYQVAYIPGGPMDDTYIPLTSGVASWEKRYREFVYSRYLDVPEAARQALTQLNQLALSAENFWPSELEPKYQERAFQAMCTAKRLEQAAVYDLNVSPMEPGEDFVTHFLEEGRGYCVHFATAGTLLLRLAGIPARYVEGYAPWIGEGEVSDVRDSDAHAWVEIYLDGYGWYPVEMTPGRQGERADMAAPEILQTETPPQLPEEELPEEEEELDNSKPETSEQTEKESTAGGGDTPEKQRDYSWLWKTAAALFALSVPFAAYRLARLVGKRRREHPDTNRSVIYAYLRYQRFLKHGGPEEPELEELGRKAKFSQHKLTEEERAAAWRCAAHAAEAWRNGLRLGRKKKGG